MHRRAVGVVALDSLMRLEVAAHRRAEAIGLVDVRPVGEPIESVITRHVCPASHVSLIPSAVAMYVVSPRVRIPFGVTYCHSGPSWPNSQFFHVLPPSVDSPQPFPTVPYQISPCGPKP